MILGTIIILRERLFGSQMKSRIVIFLKQGTVNHNGLIRSRGDRAIKERGHPQTVGLNFIHS